MSKKQYFQNIIPNDFVENKMATSPSGLPVMPRIYPESTHLYEATKAKWIDPASGYVFQRGTINFTDLRTGKTYDKFTPINEQFDMFDEDDENTDQAVDQNVEQPVEQEVEQGAEQVADDEEIGDISADEVASQIIEYANQSGKGLEFIQEIMGILSECCDEEFNNTESANAGEVDQTQEVETQQ